MQRPASKSKPVAKPAVPAKPVTKAPARKGTAKQAEPPKRSPALRVLAENELPTSHPLIGKKVTATISGDANVGRKARIIKGKVEYGDQTTVRIQGQWYWTSSVSFS